MRRSLMLVVAIGFLVGADAAQDEAKKLEGTWVMVAGEKDGKKLAKEIIEKAKLVIKGAKHTVYVGDDTIIGTHKVDPTKKPKTIDSTDTEGPFKDKTILGIYEIKGNQFKVCFNGPGKDRPKDFASVDLMHVWKRKGK